MCRDGTHSGLRALRRTQRWQDSVHVESIQRAMTRVKASFSFKIRKMSFGAQLELATRARLNLKPLGSVETDDIFAKHVSRLVTSGENETSVAFWIYSLLKAMGGGAGIGGFVEWLTVYVRPASRSQQRRPWELDKLPPLRLHIGRNGRIEKNFPSGVREKISYQRIKSSMLAKKLFRAVTPHATHCLPAFIIREASGYPHRRTLDSAHSPVNASRHAEASPMKKALQPTPPAVCHFLRLPAEIRNLIYEYTLGDSDTDSNNEVNLLTAASPTPALPLTCKQIGEECGLMYLTNFKNFWRTSNFYIDSSALLTGWHLRPTLMQLPERELEKIQNLRVSFVAKNGVYNAVWEEGHWVLRRVGGPDPSGRGVVKRRLWGAEECVMIYRFPSGMNRSRRGSDYETDVIASTNVRRLAENKVMIDRLRYGRIPMRGQIFALIKEFHRWY